MKYYFRSFGLLAAVLCLLPGPSNSFAHEPGGVTADEALRRLEQGNARFVALPLLRNAEISAEGILPFCQDTGTATVIGKKGQQVWTGANDAEFLSKGVYQTYTEENLRYSQTIPLDMYQEVNSGTNLPAQIDLYATEGASYEFLFVAKGGGSANKTSLFQ